ncbi:MAG TPA: MFS transporter [Patescibacteria group bacterium]|nr:MFS transporter [Patescibacteria group bacterium]
MKTHILHALSEKSFFKLWTGEVFTLIAIHLFNFFLILVVYKLTQSNTAVSLVVVTFTIPAILFGSLAGVLVDRWNKKYVLIVVNVLRAVLLGILVFFLDNVYVIYIISFLVATLTQFFIPAESPMIPLVVRRQLLLSANALFGVGIFGSMLIAYVLSGPMMLFFGPTKTLLFLIAMFVIGAGVISLIQLPKQQTIKKNLQQVKLSIRDDMKKTLLLISQTKAIFHSLLFIALAQILILILATIAPGYASQVLGISVEEFPLLFVAPAAVGMVLGSVIVVNVFHSHPKERVITLGLFISGLAMLCLPFGSKVASREFVQIVNSYLPHIFDITILHIMAALAFLLGIANALVFVPANTLIQEKTTDEVRGKIYGFLNALVGVIALVPVLLVGGLSDLIGVSWVIGGIGICLLIFGIVRVRFT